MGEVGVDGGPFPGVRGETSPRGGGGEGWTGIVTDTRPGERGFLVYSYFQIKPTQIPRSLSLGVSGPTLLESRHTIEGVDILPRSSSRVETPRTPPLSPRPPFVSHLDR